MGPGFESLKVYQSNIRADMAELADALDLGSSVFDVGVQVPSSAPEKSTHLSVGTMCAFFNEIRLRRVKYGSAM